MRTIKCCLLITTALKQTNSAEKRMAILAIMLATVLIISGSVNYARAEMLSKASSFGPDTITYDTKTGLSWLDVTLSTPYSYDEILIELEAGGEFHRYRLATMDEILSFWENAGINVDSGFLNSWTTDNFQPIVDLMALVGITGPNAGNLGGGNSFDFTAGHIDRTVVYPGDPREWVYVATIGADPDPTLTGEPGFGSVPTDNLNLQHGSWLILKSGLKSGKPLPEVLMLLLDE